MECVEVLSIGSATLVSTIWTTYHFYTNYIIQNLLFYFNLRMYSHNINPSKGEI